MFMFEQ